MCFQQSLVMYNLEQLLDFEFFHAFVRFRKETFFIEKDAGELGETATRIDCVCNLTCIRSVEGISVVLI